MNSKKTAQAVATAPLVESQDKENCRLLANLKVNNLDKDLEDAHLFKFCKKNLYTDTDRLSDEDRPSKTTVSRSCKQLPIDQTAMLIELLREEIETKYSES